MLKLKLQYFGHLIRRTDLLEKTLILEKIKGRRRGWQRIRWWDGIISSMDMSFSKLWEAEMDREAGVLQSMESQRFGHDWVIWKDPDVGKNWRQVEEGMTEDKMVVWHYWLNGQEFEQALRAGDEQGSLACCSLAAAAAAKSLQSCPTLCDPIDGSPPGSAVPGILQARTLEWVSISSSNAWKWKVKVKSLSRVQLLATPWAAAHQAPPSMGFSRQEYWSGVPLPSLCCSPWGCKYLDTTEWLNWTKRGLGDRCVCVYVCLCVRVCMNVFACMCTHKTDKMLI